MVDDHSSPPHAVHPRRPWRAWLRLALVASCVIALVGVAGCGTATYTCATGCFRGVVLNKSNFGLAGIPWVVETDMYVTPVKCDAACRASSGTPNNPGSISTFTLVAQGSYQIVGGYGTDPFGGQQFFVDAYLPNLPNTRYWLGTTAADTTSFSPYYIDVSIFAVPRLWLCYRDDTCATSQCPPNTMGWGVMLNAPVDSPVAQAQELNYTPVGGCSTFVPDGLAFGQYLVGKSGGSSEYTYFIHNKYDTTFPTQYRAGNPFADIDVNGHYLTADGTVSAQPGPPYVGWGNPPSKDQTGGDFYTLCCFPPCDALIC